MSIQPADLQTIAPTFQHGLRSPLHRYGGFSLPRKGVASPVFERFFPVSTAYKGRAVEKLDCEAINAFAKGKSSPHLSNIFLRGNMRDAIFRNLSINRSDMAETALSSLVKCNFSVITFEGATFDGDIIETNFDSCRFDGATFDGGVTFSSVRFGKCSFYGTRFHGAYYYLGKFKRGDVVYRSSKLLGQASRIATKDVSGYDFYFFKGYRGGPDFVKAGCRLFTIKEYKRHIIETNLLSRKKGRNGSPKALQTLEILRYFERLSRLEDQGKKS